MNVVTTINELRDHINSLKSEQKSIGFVATMGALHKGHLSLMERAKQENDVLVTSIFVNPLQFGPAEDYEMYPRSLEKDRKLAQSQKTDILFAPVVDEMYPRPMFNEVNVISGTDVLCGKSRPGHFNGVATVVLKLFQLVQPNNAYFGQKDAQQVAIIKNLVKDFNIPVHVVACETMREEDGLAISSRNIYLSDKERLQAAFLYESLQRVMRRIEEGITDSQLLEKEMNVFLKKHTDAPIDYAQILSFPELKTIDKIAGSIIIAGAVQFTKARLIDNILLHVNEMEGGNKYVSYYDEI
ncbi:pantoate--beta-alanine ligase [Alteribacillus sp. YIM 98480]|uniref:pantoate--beta-alanine ligase n=1 Tax=Alteribacillus sp. YIM 98480 TaxID=2606599 RepID=UPI00131AD5D8|nr:pantoate--beta-alanine ligase [Alteribacillus sp. YIM 98480]